MWTLPKATIEDLPCRHLGFWAKAILFAKKKQTKPAFIILIFPGQLMEHEVTVEPELSTMSCIYQAHQLKRSSEPSKYPPQN